MNEDNIINLEETIEEENQASEEELQKFYEENKDAIDLLGGLSMFETLFEIEDEAFIQLKPQMVALFAETLNEPESINELKALILAENYTAEKLETDFEYVFKAIEEIDFLSEPKKDFLKEIYSMVGNHMQPFLGGATSSIQIPCQLDEDVTLPTYAHETDAGLDIYAREEITLAPGETKIIKTGIRVAIPEGYAILIQPRSGQSVKTKLRIANTPGLIDSGYRDEIGVILENIEPPFKDIDYEFDENGEIHIKSILHGEAYTIVPGQRFAQMRLVQVPKAVFMQVESVGEIGEDRGGGFGSSGN